MIPQRSNGCRLWVPALHSDAPGSQVPQYPVEHSARHRFSCRSPLIWRTMPLTAPAQLEHAHRPHTIPRSSLQGCHVPESSPSPLPACRARGCEPSQAALHLRPHLLDRAHVRTAGRQVLNYGPGPSLAQSAIGAAGMSDWWDRRPAPSLRNDLRQCAVRTAYALRSLPFAMKSIRLR